LNRDGGNTSINGIVFRGKPISVPAPVVARIRITAG